MSKGNRRIKLTMRTIMYHGIGRIQMKCKDHGKGQEVAALEAPRTLVLTCGCKLQVPD